MRDARAGARRARCKNAAAPRETPERRAATAARSHTGAKQAQTQEAHRCRPTRAQSKHKHKRRTADRIMEQKARERRAKLARETLEVIREGGYTAVSTSEWIDVSESITASRSGTVVVDRGAIDCRALRHAHATTFDFGCDCSLAAAKQLADSSHGRSVAVLNFASAKHPGGGWLKGAQAQEEELTRCSTLYAALTSDCASAMYASSCANLKLRNDGLYTSTLCYSPEVTVIRDADGALLDKPFRAAFITAAAPNAGHARRCGVSEELIEAALTERAELVLATAAAHGHDALVLGAWGCGCFKNEPAKVAAIFAQLLRGPYYGVFMHVSFPLRDDDNRAPFLESFRRCIGE